MQTPKNLISHLQMMGQFNTWVNNHLLTQTELLSDDVYKKNSGLFFGSVHNTLNHLLLVDIMWRCRIQSRPHSVSALNQVLYADFNDLKLARREEDQALIGLLESLDEEHLFEVVKFKYLDGTVDSLQVSVILMTLFNHQTHHRGQINAVLTQNGIRPPDVDVLDYLNR